MKTAKHLAMAGVIAALYVALTYANDAGSFGAIQIRISEALTVLPVFTPAAIPGLFIGCLAANVIHGAVLPDIIFGSLTTLLAATLTRYFRKNIFAALAPPVVLNAVFVGLIVQFCYGSPFLLPVTMLTVGAGQLIACYAGGLGLYCLLRKHANRML